MEIDVTPAPSPGEREALFEGVERLLAPAAERRTSAWWREGVRENVTGDEAEDRLDP